MTEPSPTRIYPAPPHVVVPVLFSVRVRRSLLPDPPIAIPPLAVVVPPPRISPDVQLKGPVIEITPAPPSVVTPDWLKIVAVAELPLLIYSEPLVSWVVPVTL